MENEPRHTSLTFGFAVVAIASLILLVSLAVASIVAVQLMPRDVPAQLSASATQQIVCIQIILLLILFNGRFWKDILAFQLPTFRKGLLWSFMFLAYIACLNGALALLGRDDSTQAMLKIWYQCVGSLRIALIITIVVLAPVGEEMFFRGLVYGGISRSTSPVIAAVVSTSAWVLLHTQYYRPEPMWPELAGLFIMGIFLCVIRHKTHSLWLTIQLHAINNIIGTAVLWVES